MGNCDSMRSTDFHSAWIQEKLQLRAEYRLPLRVDSGEIPIPYGVQAPTLHGFRRNSSSIRSTGPHSARIQEKYQFHTEYRPPLRTDSGKIPIPYGVQAPTLHGFMRSTDFMGSTDFHSVWIHEKYRFHGECRLPLCMDSWKITISCGVQTSTLYGFMENYDFMGSAGFHSAWIQEKLRFHTEYRLPLCMESWKIPISWGVQASTPHGFRKNYDSIRSTDSHSAWIQEKLRFHAQYRLPICTES